MPGKPKKASKYTLGRQSSDGGHDLELPSGATCRARRPGVQGLITAGLLDNFDQLTALVQTEHIDPHTPKGQIAAARKVTADDVASAASIMADKEKLHTAFLTMDRIAAYCIMEPVVWIDYQLKDESDEDWDKRQAKATEDEALAVREIDLDDKMYVLNWAVGGVADLAAFRAGTNELLGNVAAS